MNNLKTAFLLIVLSGLLVWVGGLFGGRQGAVIAFGIAAVMNMGAYWFSDRMVLAMYRAKPVTEAEAPELYGIVADLAQRTSSPMPKVYIIPSDTPNAFATGRSPKHAAVAATRGILRMLDRDELQGVLAHELSHVRHRDILLSSVAATLVAAISMLARFAEFAAIFGMGRGDEDENPFALLIITMVAAFGAMLLQLALSRSREFEADAGGARLLGTGEPLARALEKIEAGVRQVPMNANPATAHLFIVSPLAGGRRRAAGLMARLFSTHPPTAERIARLRNRTWAS